MKNLIKYLIALSLLSTPVFAQTGQLQSGQVWGNSTASQAPASGNTVPQMLSRSGALPIANGGSGQVTNTAAFNALAPSPTRAGDVTYWNGSNYVNLPGNNSGTQVLQETSSGVPSWATVAGTGTVTSITCGATTITTSGTCPTIAVVKKQTFTSTGTYTPSTGLVYAVIECLGSGGGGAGAINVASGEGSGGGGGAGSYSRVVVSAATVGASKAVTIGAAGSGGLSTTPWTGGNGNDTSVGTLCIGKAGQGGNSNGSGTSGQGGNGGVAGTGDITGTGEPGGSGISSSIVTISVPSGRGGSTLWGGGGVSVVGNASHTGDAGTGFGSGGAGGVSFNNGGAAPGGAGTAGFVAITEYTNQ